MTDTKVNVLNKTPEILIVDLLGYIALMTDELVSGLIEPDKGIYVLGNLTPCIALKDSVCFTDKRDTFITDAEEILTRKVDLVDKDGMLLFTGKEIEKKLKHLSTKPYVNPNAVELALRIVDNFISVVTMHTGYIHRKRYEDLIKPKYQRLIDDESYEASFHPLIDHIEAFIRKDPNHIYYTRVRGCSLIIEKKCDYRIIEYYDLLEEIETLKHTIKKLKGRE